MFSLLKCFRFTFRNHNVENMIFNEHFAQVSTMSTSRTCSGKISRSRSWSVTRRIGQAITETIERLETVNTEISVAAQVRRKPYGCKVEIFIKRRRDHHSKCNIAINISDEFHENFCSYLIHLIEAHCLTLLQKGTDDSSDSSD